MSYAVPQILAELAKLRAGSVRTSETNSNTLRQSMVRSDIGAVLGTVVVIALVLNFVGTAHFIALEMHRQSGLGGSRIKSQENTPGR